MALSEVVCEDKEGEAFSLSLREIIHAETHLPPHTKQVITAEQEEPFWRNSFLLRISVFQINISYLRSQKIMHHIFLRQSTQKKSCSSQYLGPGHWIGHSRPVVNYMHLLISDMTPEVIRRFLSFHANSSLPCELTGVISAQHVANQPSSAASISSTYTKTY